jgi:mannose-6-phosphate isomerase-like protein (cupin superfamily)
MGAQAKKIQVPQGTFRHYSSGAQVEQQHEERSVAAVVSGCLRLKVDNQSMVLRASDAATIPARARYQLEAIDDSLVYHYAEPGEETLWGV